MNSPTDILHPSPAPQVDTSQVFLIYFFEVPSFSTTENYAPNAEFH